MSIISLLEKTKNLQASAKECPFQLTVNAYSCATLIHLVSLGNHPPNPWNT